MRYIEKTPTVARIVATACVCVLLCAMVIDLLPTRGEEHIYEDVVRLHVLANSDDAHDQAVKLRVRDAILRLLADGSTASMTKEQAEAYYRTRLDEIAACAEETVAAYGEARPCRVTLSKEYYPARTYGEITLPRGEYTSLRVQIGAAEGQNWWCVLFPPLCLRLAMADGGSEEARAVYAEEGEQLLAAGFTPEEVALLCEEDDVRVTVKFRIVEWLRALFAER